MSTPHSICRLRYLWARSPQHSRRIDGVPLRICRSVWSSSLFFKLTRLEPSVKVVVIQEAPRLNRSNAVEQIRNSDGRREGSSPQFLRNAPATPTPTGILDVQRLPRS